MLKRAAAAEGSCRAATMLLISRSTFSPGRSAMEIVVIIAATNSMVAACCWPRAVPLSALVNPVMIQGNSQQGV